MTLPGAKYGLISAALVVFTLVITDFGIAKVIGGNFNVLATDVYKQVIGQQNFSMGAVVGMVLLAPAALAFVVDRLVQRKQVALLTARAVPLVPKPKPGRDFVFTLICTLVSIGILAILGMAIWGSLIKYWPYNLSLTLDNYDFAKFDANGWDSYWNSVEMAVGAALFGTALMFTGAWLTEKTRGFHIVRGVVQLLAFLPMAVPGLVLGLGYIFFFNAPGNPLGFLYATMGILVVNTVAHFYTVGHLTATTALKQIDPEFESVSASLKVPIWRTFSRVTAPICLPSILDIAIYLFVNAMTTVSSVIFLYSPDTKLASVAAVNIEEAGTTAAAAALCVVIVLTSAAVKIVHLLADRFLLDRLQAWRRRLTLIVEILPRERSHDLLAKDGSQDVVHRAGVIVKAAMCRAFRRCPFSWAYQIFTSFPMFVLSRKCLHTEQLHPDASPRRHWKRDRGGTCYRRALQCPSARLHRRDSKGSFCRF